MLYSIETKMILKNTQHQSPSMVPLLSGTQYVGKKTMTSEYAFISFNTPIPPTKWQSQISHDTHSCR